MSDEAPPNEFEIAVLKRMANQLLSLSPVISELTVASRKLTGVGSFTNFANNHAELPDAVSGPLALDAQIAMPGVRHGLGALLFFDVNSIAVLEIYSYGDETWSGNWEGFSFVESAVPIA
jgi:hypothetical protein